MTVENDQQAVYILNRRPYQESSLIVDVFSLNYGRQSVVAKGALKSKKYWSALLQVFQPLMMTWRGRSSLKTLQSLEAPSMPFKLKAERLFCGYYLNELISRLLPESEANANIFFLYGSAIEALSVSDNIQVPLRLFEVGLLSELGLAPDFTVDADDEKISVSKVYCYEHHVGFIDAHKQSRAASHVSGLATMLIKGDVLIRLANKSFISCNCFANHSEEKEFLKQSKLLMRVLIDHALGGRELKSRELFKQIKY